MSTQSAVGHETTTVRIEDLLVGGSIQFPILDSHGVLLLAEGSVITSEAKKALKARGYDKVQVSTKDLDSVTLNPTLANRKVAGLQSSEELTRKLDAIADAGIFSLKNEGPAVKKDQVFLGCRGYDREQREKLVEQHRDNENRLDEMLKTAMRGEEVSGEEMAQMSAGYLKEMLADSDNLLTSTLKEFGHDDVAARSLEVALLAMAIGVEMELDEENARSLAVSGLVHDWGMMKVPREIRRCDRKLSALERLEIQKHPIYSLELLQQVAALPRVVPLIAYQVHERINGSGYPRGRCGYSIHPLSRVLQVADEFVTMTTAMPGQPPLTRYAAMECLLRQAREKHVDPEVMRALLKVVSLFPVGSFIQLSDGTVAQVMRSNREHYTEPIVARVQDDAGQLLEADSEADLIDLHKAPDLTVAHALPTPGSEEVPLTDERYQESLQE